MQTFLEYYQCKIQPQIAEIDLFLKSEEPPYDNETVRALLAISSARWAELMQQEKLSFLTKGNFFRLMQQGDSPLCGMFRRAIALHLPEQYTPEVIAYIFALEIAAVRRAAKEMGQSVFTEKMLPELFAKISLAETQYLF